ncbi:TonB-dependent receptor [Asticcacaulis sp. BYS171W]|uniref:TonB-dependent receptor n=1 Tax=Asticcacaulis aquaticus TaxID=2984212 RepID=A0ABT5HRN5_9CAUL|nr:TonB-dependent receptor [Asticcacaulis aquaticus]MDC7682116.1 TonB-dependent receptor [Asticcacaulis aquaticus]
MRRVKSLLCAGVATAGLSMACGAFAQDAQPTAEKAADEPQEVIVTGSRIARTGFDASTPVAVVREEDIRRSGNINIERTLLQLPQSFGSSTGSSFSNEVSGQSSGFVDINLRGFGSSRNLVLVNGRRFAIFDARQITDLNSIPSSLIARTEVVTGGSSAVYGSDAITGVVNFVMKDNFEGVEAKAQYNWVGHTGTPTYNLDFTAGGNFDGGRGNMVVSLNYVKREPVFRGDYDWSYYGLGESCVANGTGTATTPGTQLVPPSGQTCAQAGGYIGYIFSGSGDIPNGRFSGIPSFGGSNAGLNAAYTAAGLSGMGSFGFTFNDTGTTARPAVDPTDRYNNQPPNYLQSAQDRYMLNSFAHYDLSDRATAYMELHYSYNKVAGQLAATNVGSPTLFNTNNPYLSTQMREVLRQLDIAETSTTTVTAGNALFTNAPNDGLAVITAGRRYSDLGPRHGSNTRNVFRGAWGLRGSLPEVSPAFLRELKYDAYYSYAHTEESILVLNGISRSRLQRSLLSVGGAAPVCNIFGQNVSQACATAIATNSLSQTSATMQVIQANLTGILLTLPAGDVGFSGGAEWRKTEGEYVPDQGLATGDIAGYSPGLSTKGSVTVKELFGELRIPVLADLPLVKALTVNTGFRQSDYSLKGVGSVSTYFYGADWKVNRDVAFRAQYQRAIRAPNIQELFGGLTTNSVVVFDPCSSRAPTSLQTADVRALCVATGVPSANVFGTGVQPNAFVQVQTGGNPNLSEETSDTKTLGVVFTPSFLPRLFVSVDYFNIELEGAIAPLGGGAQNAMNLCYYTVKDAASEFCRAIPRLSSTGEIVENNPLRVLNANTGALKTSGYDLAVRYRIEANFGLPRLADRSTFDLTGNFTWLEDFTRVPVSALPAVQNDCVGTFGGTCGTPLPHVRGFFRATWNVGDLSVSVRDRYFGPVTTDRYIVPMRQGSASTPALNTIAYPTIKAQNYIDLSIDYDLNDKIKLFGGANNLFNVEMPNQSGQQTYDALGTEFFVGVTAKF